MMSGMSLHPYPKGAHTGCQISIPPFDMTSHPLTSRYGYQSNIRRRMFTFQIISMIKRISTEVRVLPKFTVDDKASSKTHLVRLMHNVVTSKFKIFSVAKARCWNTRLSPKTPKVFPVLSSSSKIQFLGKTMASIPIYLQCCCLPTTHKTTTEQNKTNTHTRQEWIII